MLRTLSKQRAVPLLAALFVLLVVASVAVIIKPRHTPEDPQVARSSGPLASSKSEQEAEGVQLEGMLEYWYHRLTYPTGRYDPAWLRRAAEQNRHVLAGTPAGRVTYSRLGNPSPLVLDPDRWTSLGPQPEYQSFWGATSGRINAIVIDPVNPDVGYLGVAGGGVWKTTNCCSATSTWAPAMEDPLASSNAIGDLVLDPNNHNTLYAATGDNIYNYTESGAGIFRSTDAGGTWTLLPNSPISQYRASSKLRIDPNNSSTLVLGTKDGLFLSYDAGTTWTSACVPDPYPTQGQDITSLILRSTGPSATDIYAAVGTVFSNGVLTNTTNGANGIYRAVLPSAGCPAGWALLSRPDNGWPAGTGGGIPGSQGGNTLGRIDIDMAPNNRQYIYVQVHKPVNHGQLGVWRSSDGGSTWEQRSTAAALTNCFGQSGDVPQNWFNQGLLVDPANPNTVYMNTVTLWRSTDGGATFSDISCSYSGGTVHPDLHAFAFKPGAPNVFMVGGDGGIYITESITDPVPSWNSGNETINTIEFYGGDISANFAYSPSPGAMGGSQDNGVAAYVWEAPATPGPAGWQLTLGGDGIYTQIEPVLGERWYQEYQYGRLRVSTNGAFGSPQFAEGGWFIANERINPLFPYQLYKNDCPSTGCTHMIAGSHRVYETIEGAVPATSWYLNSLDLTKNLGRRSYINSVQYAQTLSTTAIIGTNDGNVQYGFGLGQGTAYSATWVDVTGGNSMLPNRPILDVTTSPLDPFVGYAALGGFDANTPSTPGHVFQVTCTPSCAGFTWVNKTGNLPDIPINTLAANPRYPGQVFAGSNWALYYTDNIYAASPVWNRFNAGLPNAVISELAIDAGHTTLSAWTRSRGAYVWPLPSDPSGPTPTPTTVPEATATRTSTAISTPTATRTAAPSSTYTPGASTTPPPPTATACTLTFSDVPPDNTFYPFVRCLACRGIVNGYPDGTFKPNNPVTRGQLAKIVSQSAGFTEPVSGQTFEDVAPGSTFYEYVERLASRQVMGGYQCGIDPSEPCGPGNRPYFRPNAGATRGQLTKIVSNAAGFADTIPAGQYTFTDVQPGSTFWLYVERLLLNRPGVMSGYACGGPGEPCDSESRPYFRPGNSLTRGQTSKIVANTVFPDCQTRARR